MIDYSEFEKIPENTKDKIIDSIFASNIPSELIRIKNDIKANKNKSEFIEPLLESIRLKYNNSFGRFYEVVGLYCVSQKEFGINLEEDNS